MCNIVVSQSLIEWSEEGKEIEKKLTSIKELNNSLRQTERVVIYGSGRYGKRLVDYIISIEESKKIQRIIVTKPDLGECEYKGIEIQRADSFLESVEAGRCSVIIAASLIYSEQMGKVVEQYGREYQYITTDLFFEMGVELEIPYNSVDFILADYEGYKLARCQSELSHETLFGEFGSIEEKNWRIILIEVSED